MSRYESVIEECPEPHAIVARKASSGTPNGMELVIGTELKTIQMPLSIGQVRKLLVELAHLSWIYHGPS